MSRCSKLPTPIQNWKHKSMIISKDVQNDIMRDHLISQSIVNWLTFLILDISDVFDENGKEDP